MLIQFLFCIPLLMFTKLSIFSKFRLRFKEVYRVIITRGSQTFYQYLWKNFQSSDIFKINKKPLCNSKTMPYRRKAKPFSSFMSRNAVKPVFLSNDGLIDIFLKTPLLVKFRPRLYSSAYTCIRSRKNGCKNLIERYKIKSLREM